MFLDFCCKTLQDKIAYCRKTFDCTIYIHTTFWTLDWRIYCAQGRKSKGRKSCDVSK